MIEKDNPYTRMQVQQYTDLAARGAEAVVGNSIDSLNGWDWHDFLFNKADLSDKVGLDFGAGPGRNIKLLGGLFKRLDAVDLSERMKEEAGRYLATYTKPYTYYVCNGYDLSIIADDSYDIVMSVISLQHICVHEIRYNYFKEFYRVLKSGGMFTAQMGFGERQGAADYYANDYIAGGTNGLRDTKVTDPEFLKKDLEEIGFTNFNHKVGARHPSDIHDQWIYFSAIK